MARHIIHAYPVVILLCLFLPKITTEKLDHQVLIISFDGFRWDYLDLVNKAGYKTPNFNRMIQQGSKAKWVKNCYTTITFPNHYSIATGLYEENHGMVSNNMFDPVYQEVFTGQPEQQRESKWYNNGTDDWKGEPIWLTNQKVSGQHTGVYFWVGSEAAIKGQHAYHYRTYKKTVPFKERVETVVGWLTAKEDPVNFAMLYFHEPDGTGHGHGPNSVALKEEVVKLDGLLGFIFDQLKQHNIYDSMDIIVTSDHGMSEMNSTIYLEDYIDSALYSVYGVTPVLHILPKDGNNATVLNKLQKIPNIHVYRKEDIPADYHYRYNRRIQPIIIEAFEGHLLCAKKHTDCVFEKGDHGFNNSHPNMRPFFIASGPSFKQNFVSDPFNNVDIYPLLCKLLGVDPAYHDGSLDVISSILVDDEEKRVYLGTLLAVGISMGILLLISAVYCCASFVIKRTRRSRVPMITDDVSDDEALLS